MGIVKAFTGIFGKKEKEQAVQAPAVKPQTVDCAPPVDEDIALGVKYANRFAWQMSPPAGWRRQENTAGVSWPDGGVSPTVSFVNPHLQAGEQCMIRWQLMSSEESSESHQLLANLFSGNVPVTIDSISAVEAPGLVKGTKIQSVEKVTLPGDHTAIIVSTKLDQCKGEQPILRYILLFPDRRMGNGWFRETVQFMATENIFWTNERIAIGSIRTFRRNAEDQTATGSFRIPASLGANQ
jgi:hypothetical protein